jgi:signal transduction histidine kinase
MEDRTIVRLVRLGALVGVVLAVSGSVVTIALAGVEAWWLAFGGFMAIFSLSFAVVAWLVIGQQPRNRVVWIMGAVGFGGGIWLAGIGATVLHLRDTPALIENAISGSAIPADIGTTGALVRGITEAIGIPPLIALFTLGLLLLPDGHLSSGRRWRWFAGVAVTAVALNVVGALWSFRPWNDARSTDDVIYGIAATVSAIAAVLALIGLVGRFRASSGATRDRFKWIVFGAAVFVPAILTSMAISGTQAEPTGIALLTAGAVVLVGSFGIAVGRYQLFDVDVVIRRTAIVGGLAVFITVVYAVVVGAVGLVVGFQTEATLPLSIAATVVVAVAIQPLRERMRRLADRLVYGDRASPYEVLSRFSARTRDAVATEDVMPYLAELLASGTDADRAVVWLRHGDELRPAAAWPPDVTVAPVAHTGNGVVIEGTDRTAPVEHDGELLGAVSVTMPVREEMSAAAQRLVDDIASQAGLVLRNARLIDELRSSRQRLVAAQDEERRRLERDLHDGAQQQFIAVKMKAGLARQLAAKGDGERAAGILEEVLTDVDAGVESLRDLAHGIYPPLLEAEGLPAALRARARKAPIPVTIEADGLGRYPRETEAAVYFCVLEALQNAAKYSHADAITVTLHHNNGTLGFEVADDGDGFDPTAKARGRGLTNMTDRLDALGGTLTIQSSSGAGTTIVGSVAAAPMSGPDT